MHKFVFLVINSARLRIIPFAIFPNIAKFARRFFITKSVIRAPYNFVYNLVNDYGVSNFHFKTTFGIPVPANWPLPILVR